jgi:hypothetical protein
MLSPLGDDRTTACLHPMVKERGHRHDPYISTLYSTAPDRHRHTSHTPSHPIPTDIHARACVTLYFSIAYREQIFPVFSTASFALIALYQANNIPCTANEA